MGPGECHGAFIHPELSGTSNLGVLLIRLTTKELWETLYKVYGNVSNLTRVFEVKRAINALIQADMEFQAHFGKFRSLWVELEMLTPHTVDPSILTDRHQEDKVFGLLLTLNPTYNDLIKHILRADRLPTFDEV